MALTGACMAANAKADGPVVNGTNYIYAYKDGKVIYRADTNVVDSLAIENSNTQLSFFAKDGVTRLFKIPYANVDSISIYPPHPTATLLDVKFMADGTAVDASPMHHTVQVIGSTDAAYNPLFKQYTATFDNEYGINTTNYCKVDYTNNTAFRNALADGHTLECTFKVHYDAPIPNRTVKPFASHESGGTGLEIFNTYHDMGMSIHTTDNGVSAWRVKHVTTMPQPDVYYHLVGVWDKAKGVALTYINGQLASTAGASGELDWPIAGCTWFGIGCDAATPTGNLAGANFEIVNARIYDDPLDKYQVDALWNDVSQIRQFPYADILDMYVTDTHSLLDISPLQNTIRTYTYDDRTGNASTPSHYNPAFGTWSADFNNTWGCSKETTEIYGRVDYAGNSDFINGLNNGHTFECLFKANDIDLTQDIEYKMFAAHEAGGSGFVINKLTPNSHWKKSHNVQGKEQDFQPSVITFLTDISTEKHDDPTQDWVWAQSGVKVEANKFYHVLGIWDNVAQVTKIYVNGALCSTMPAPGTFNLPQDVNAQWVGIGGDAYGEPFGAHNPGDFEMVNARIYSWPLSPSEAQSVWEDVAHKVQAANDSLSTPRADMMDIEFGPAGAVRDVAMPAHSATFANHASDGPVTYYNTDLGRYVANFDNPQDGAATECVDAYIYASDTAWQTKLTDGNTLETILMFDHDGEISWEYKAFSSMESGGLGIILRHTGNRGLSYLTHIGGSYVWNTNRWFAERGVYYHFVGVYDKAKNQVRTYIDGQLVSSQTVSGNQSLPNKAASQHFVIGGDSGNSGDTNGWVGDIAMARIYDAPMGDAEVALLYKKVADARARASRYVQDYHYSAYDESDLPNADGGVFAIAGHGFEAGDQLVIMPGNSDMSDAVTVALSLTTNGASAQLPSTVIDGKRYAIYLQRHGRQQSLGVVKFRITASAATVPAGSKTIAHRGYWNVDNSGSNTTQQAQNSRQSLRDAIRIGCYGSETDVWMTTDKVLMVNHDATFAGKTIASETSATCQTLTLANGETMPTLVDFLNIVRDHNHAERPTKLIIEVKNHSTAALNREAGQRTVAAVHAANVSDRVEYISFSLDACQAIVAADPNAHVAYLNGDKSPQELYNMGIMGLDYTAATYTANPTWIDEAHALGMTTNVWTIDSRADILSENARQQDFVTTNNPDVSLRIGRYYQSRH